MISGARVLGLDFDGSFVGTTDDSTRQNAAGQEITIPTREGYRTFCYLHAEEAFAIGQVAAQFLHEVDADVDAANSTNGLKGTGDFTAGEFNDGTLPAAYVTIDTGTGLGQTRAIVSNRGSADDLVLEDNNWDTALDTTSDFVVWDPTHVSLCDTDDTPIQDVKGVALGAISDENWGWFQKQGICPLVRFVGDTDAAVAGEGIVPSGTAGAARGFTSGGTTADEVSQMFGKALHAYAAADSAGRGIAAKLTIV